MNDAAADSLGVLPKVSPDGAICCHHCGFDYLSFLQVIVAFREEDCATGIGVVVNKELGFRVSDDIKANPSNRRSGIIIQMQCENCPEITELSLAEHKGLMIVQTR